MANDVTPEERQHCAGLALRLLTAHEPALVDLLTIEWSARFTSRLGDAAYMPARGHLGPVPGVAQLDALRARLGAPPRTPQRLPEPMARVRFSIPLWARASREQRDETVAHEVAHLVVFHRARRGDYGGRRVAAHGREWQAVMRRMGYEPNRTHNVDTSGLKRRKPRTQTVHCHGCGEAIPVTDRLWRNIRALETSGRGRYNHTCGGVIHTHRVGEDTSSRLEGDAAGARR